MTTNSTAPSYFTRYENLAFERMDGGVLTLRFHTNGGPTTFTGQAHEDLPRALEEITLDRDNRALVITGTGGAFMDSIDGGSLGEIFKSAHWEKIRREGTGVLQRLLDSTSDSYRMAAMQVLRSHQTEPIILSIGPVLTRMVMLSAELALLCSQKLCR